MALVGDSVRGDMLQTTVSFTDHRISSPNIDEVGTRQAIKCMIFKDLISYIQDRAGAAKCDAIERDTRLKSLRSRLHHSVDKADEEVDRADLETRIAMLENDIESNGLRAVSLDGTLSFVSEVFAAGGIPRRFDRVHSLESSGRHARRSSTEPGYDVSVSQVLIGSRGPRVLAVVFFRRGFVAPARFHRSGGFVSRLVVRFHLCCNKTVMFGGYTRLRTICCILPTGGVRGRPTRKAVWSSPARPFLVLETQDRAGRCVL